MSLSAGLYPVPSGHLAAVVTYFQLSAPFVGEVSFPQGAGVALEDMSATEYQTLFRQIGEPWLWVSRLKLSDAELAAILNDPKVETWIVRRGTRAIGLVELDYRVDNRCELAFFGLVPSETGSGLGRAMMAFAQKQAFSRPISGVDLHTCTLDSPRALPFYLKCGFQPIERRVEIFEDPRGTGNFPATAAPNQPVIGQ